ncbi:MAG: carbohydrate kinase family protein [Candidatus Aminicenantia bacterium]
MLGLLGTITFDRITSERGTSFNSLGGILYQAAILSGIGQLTKLYSHLGMEFAEEVFKIINNWSFLDKTDLKLVPGQGNQVNLFYPRQGERIEILNSVVPALDYAKIIKDKQKLKMLMAVFNSGYDLTLKNWHAIVDTLNCPIWLDIHSLVLERKLGEVRKYTAFPKWIEWAKGVTYLQANRQEIAAMLGKPNQIPSVEEINEIAERALALGIKIFFITLGQEGVLMISSKSQQKITSPQVKHVIDTTGCGDVFAAATVAKLMAGDLSHQAAQFGVKLASQAVSLIGPAAVYNLAKQYRKNLSHED